MISEETRIRLITSHIGKKQSLETIEKRVSKFRGADHWLWKGERRTCPDCGGKKYTYSIRCRKCSESIRVGDKIHNWKGGISKEVDYKLHQNLIRRARRFNAEGEHSFQDWLELKIKYGYMCLCCKKSEPEVKLSEDHIIPLSKGGSNYISNIQPLCGSCNSIKYNKIIDYRVLTSPPVQILKTNL